MKKILAFILLCLGSTTICPAQQTGIAVFGEQGPVPSQTQLFQLNPEQYNHHFDFILPNNGKLKIDFLRLSDWGTENQLQTIAATAAIQAKLLKDSFQSNFSSKLIALNIPIDGKIISVKYREDESEKSQLAYKEGSYYQLKTSFDTIRVVKNIGIRTKPKIDSGLIQIQYTFVLKDINDIQAFVRDPSILQNIGRSADSAVHKQRSRWPRQDARIYTLNLQYNPDAPKPMTVDNGNVLIDKRIGLSLAVGFATYTNNSISPYFDESVAYLFRARGRMRYFIGFNITAFGYMNTNSDKSYFTSYNLEYGLCRNVPGFMQQKTSVQIGLMRKFNAPETYNVFHLGFNFGFNSYLSGGFSFARDFKKNSTRNLLLVNFKFNL